MKRVRANLRSVPEEEGGPVDEDGQGAGLQGDRAVQLGQRELRNVVPAVAKGNAGHYCVELMALHSDLSQTDTVQTTVSR